MDFSKQQKEAAHMEKRDFLSLVQAFTETHGREWCECSEVTESVLSAFVDFCLSQGDFDIEKFRRQ